MAWGSPPITVSAGMESQGMVDQTVANAIVAAVEAGFDEQLRVTQELVRRPSLRGMSWAQIVTRCG